MKKPKKQTELFMMRIVKGGMQPADNYTNDRLKLKGYHINDLVAVTIKKTRKYWYHKKVHKFCIMLAGNVDEFKSLDAHNILKRIQLEADIYCSHIMLNMPDIGPVQYRLPESISFDNMDQGEFEDFFKQIADYVAGKYWPEMDKEQVEQMAEITE